MIISCYKGAYIKFVAEEWGWGWGGEARLDGFTNFSKKKKLVAQATIDLNIS